MSPSPPADRAQEHRPGFVLSRPGRALAYAGLALMALVMIAAFDATWLRPLLQRYVRQHAGRQIDFDRLQFRLDAALQPVVRLRNLDIENAPWAARRPLIKASEVDITIAWASLHSDGLIVPRLALADAEMDLEMRADGLRNWRIADPQDRTPGRTRILTLQASRSSLRIVNLAQGLEIALTTTPLPAPKPLARQPQLTMTQLLHLDGTRHDTRFEGDIDIGDVLSLRDSGRPFALSARLRSGNSTLVAEGVATDLFQLAGLDLDLHFSSPDLGQSAAALGGLRSWPALAANAAGRLHKDASEWSVTDLRLNVGRSDFAGTFAVTPRSAEAASSPRPTLRANLTSQHLALDDLHRPTAAKRPQRVASAAGETAESHGGARRLEAFDAEVDLQLARVDGLPMPARLGPIRDLHTHASLRAGRLVLTPVSFALAGGEASGRLSVDASQSPAAVALDLRLGRLKLSELIDPHSSGAGIDGRLDLNLALQARGDTPGAWPDGLTGDVSGALSQATLPATLDAKLGLDAGLWLRAAVAGAAKRVAVTCSIGEMHFQAGQGRTTRLAMETDDVLLSGTAIADLQRKSFDLVLTPHRKQPALLALDKSVRLHAGVGQRKVLGLVEREEDANGGGCRRPASR